MDSEFPMNRPEQRTSTPSDRKVIGAKGRRDINGPLTDVQRTQIRALYQTLHHLGPDAMEDVVRTASVNGYVNGRCDFADEWREAVIDQCAIACLDGDFTDPRATLERLITWHVQMALDPKISEAAAALVLAAKVEALEWAATVCTDEADMAGNQARNGGTAFDDGRELAARELGAEIRAGKGYTS